jgi:RNA polymerase-binding transcription factor DksA
MRTGRRYRIEATLLAERDRAASDLHQIEEEEAQTQSVSSGTLARTHGTDAEAASDVQEETADFITATRLSARLAEIDDALRLLAQNPTEFVRCGRCASEIEGVRLELVPWSRLCSTCARLNGRLV